MGSNKNKRKRIEVFDLSESESDDLGIEETMDELDCCYGYDPTLIAREGTPEPDTALEIKKSSIDIGSKWLPITVDDEVEETHNLDTSLNMSSSSDTGTSKAGSSSSSDRIMYEFPNFQYVIIECGICHSKFANGHGFCAHMYVVHNIDDEGQYTQYEQNGKAENDEQNNTSTNLSCSFCHLVFQDCISLGDHCNNVHTDDFEVKEHINFAYDESEESDKKMC